MAVTVQQEVAALYSAIFNRAPDQAGLEFWVNAIEGGDSLVQAAEGFTQHPVFAETYAGLTNIEFVEQLYINVLGGAGDAEGIQFWVDKLASGVSKGQVVAEFVQGSLSIDLDALLASGELSQAEYDAAVARQDSLTNKANVGLHFVEKFGAATNLSADTDTTTKEGLESDPVYLASQAAIANVTADAASVTAANAAINAAGAPTDLNVAPAFTLTAGLEDLAAAKADVAAFVKAWGVENEDTSPSDTKIKAAATAAELAVENGTGATNAGAVAIANYSSSSSGVQAALVVDQRTALTKAVTDAQKATATAQDAVDAVSGLQNKYEAAVAAAKADIAADNAVLKSVNNIAALEGDVEIELGSAITVQLQNAAAVVTGVTTLVEYDATAKAYSLVDGVTEDNYVGITALVEALNVHEGLVAAAATAEKLKVATAASLADADLNSDAKAALVAVQAELADDNIVNRVQMESKVATLKALLDTAVANDALGADTTTTTVSYDATTGIATVSGDDEYASSTGAVYDAAVAFNDARQKVNAFISAAESADADESANPLTSALSSKESLQASAEDNLADFEKLVAAEAEAEATEADLIALEEAVTAAETALEDAGFAVVSVDGAEVATSDDDVFLPSTADGSIALFGLLGNDSIFVGETVYNSTEIGSGATQTALADAGDNSVVEFFLVQNGNDVEVTIENNAFGSSAATPETTVITITGVTVDSLTVADGYITLA